MNEKQVGMCRNILAIVMNNCILYGLLASVYDATNSSVPVWKLGSILLLPFLFAVLRVKSGGFFLFLLLHAGSSVILWIVLCVTIPEKIAVAVILFYITLRSLYFRIVKQETEEELIYLPFALAGVFVAYLVLAKLGAKGGGRLVQCVVVYCILYVIYRYLMQFQQFVRTNRISVTRLPEDKMIRSGGILVLAYALFMGAVLWLYSSTGITEKIMSGIKRFLLGLVRFLLSLIPYGEKEEAEAAGELMELMPEVQEIGEAAEPILLFVLLEKILGIVLPIFVAAVLCFGIYRLMIWLFHQFHQGKVQEEETKESLLKDKKRERRRKDKRREEYGIPFLAVTPEEKIRKIFIRTVLRIRKFQKVNDKPVKSATARELRLHLPDPARREAFLQLSQLYERARYAENSSTSEDVKAAKRHSSVCCLSEKERL